MRYGIIAYATNGAYMEMLRELGTSVRDSGMPFKARFPTHLWGCSWVEAVLWKPQFILDELCDTSLDGLIYTDADSKMRRRPPVEDVDRADIGLHYFHRTPASPPECLTGTMFFRKSPAVIELLEAWVAKTIAYSSSFTPEQDSLKEILSWSAHKGLVVKALDPEWCFIFDDMRAMYPKAQPIFEHFQASRRFRHQPKQADVRDVQIGRVEFQGNVIYPERPKA